MPFRAESSSFRAYSTRKPFSFHVCTIDADGSGNKRLTEKSEEKDKTAYRLVQIGPNSICCYFIIWKGCFLETHIKWAGGQLRSLQKNQNSCVFFVVTLGLLAPFVSVRFDAWVISSFCICTLPCTLSSVSFLCRKPGRESCRLPVCKEEYRCCGSPARFSGSLSAGTPLPCPSAVHRHIQTVAVFPTTFRARPTACRNPSGTPLPTRGSFL